MFGTHKIIPYKRGLPDGHRRVEAWQVKTDKTRLEKITASGRIFQSNMAKQYL